MAFQYEQTILSSDVDLHRRLRLSRLFTMLQEAAMAHTEALGFGTARTMDRGFLWVVALQQVRVSRLPVFGETVRLETVPGETIQGLFPRYYRMTDADGCELLTAASIWTLICADTRVMAAPAQTGILIHEMKADWKIWLPRPPRAAVSEHPICWTVPFSMTDLNGHMNNAQYLDLAEDHMPASLRDGCIREIRAEYAAELRLGQQMRLYSEICENSFLFSGFTDKRIFRLRFDYAPRADGSEA